jgi:hypothetical protein
MSEDNVVTLFWGLIIIIGIGVIGWLGSEKMAYTHELRLKCLATDRTVFECDWLSR